MNNRLRLTPPEADVGDRFGQVDLADLRAVWGENVHTVVAVAAPAGGGPDVAVDVDADAVGTATAHVAEDAPVGEGLAVHHVEGTDGARMAPLVRRARVDDVEDLVVGREREAIGLDQGVVDDGGFERIRVDAERVLGDLQRRLVALVVDEAAVAGVGEPDAAVRVHNDVVGRVEALALETVHEHGDRAVVLGSCHAPRAMLAGDEAALPVARIAVGVVGGVAVLGDLARDLVPAQDAVVGDVAPQQLAGVRRTRRGLPPIGSRCRAVRRRRCRSHSGGIGGRSP